jgi:hypothetical protein
MVRAGSCSAKCSQNNSKRIATSNRQTNARRAQSLDGVAKTEHSNGLSTDFFLVSNDMWIARERCSLRRTSPFM